MEGLDKLEQPFAIMFKPIKRDRCSTPPEIGIFHLFNAREGRLECVPSGDVFINVVFVICAVERQIEKVPICRIEAVALVNEGDAITAALLREHGLAAVTVARPFVECKNAGKVPPVRYRIEYRFGRYPKTRSEKDQIRITSMRNEPRAQL